MIRFDTRFKKPKVWNIAILSVITTVMMAFLLNRETYYIPAISAVVCLYLTLSIVFLLIALVKQLQYNPYSYNTIYYIGFSLFLLACLVSQIVTVLRLGEPELTDFSGLMILFYTLLRSARSYMLLSFPFIAAYSAGLCLSNISLIRHEGKRIVNILGIILSFLLIGGELFLIFSDARALETPREILVHNLVTNLFAALYLYFECMLIGTICANMIVTRYEPEKNKDYMIILGCGIRKDGTPSPLLKGRVDRALKFYREQLAETGKPLTFIPSGGQGPDEVISESASMKQYLLDNGIPEDRILMEDRSTSTYENMLFSKNVLRADDPSDNHDGRIVYATTNYHVFRSGLMARRVKMRAVGIGAKTRWYFWPNAAVREFVGLLTEHRLKQSLILGGMILLYTVSTVVYYNIV